MLTRRTSLGLLGGSALASIAGVPVALARIATDRRLIVVILRGALDGLAAVPPHGDPDYRAARGNLAMNVGGDGIIDLDGRFGLHPALAPLAELYRTHELLVVHAVATSYRERSHFDAQDLLENGTMRPRGAGDGWLNRALAALSPDGRNQSGERLGIAVGFTVPLMLNGRVPVASWAPSQQPEPNAEFLGRLQRMYRGDPQFEAALAEGIRAHAFAGQALAPEPAMTGPNDGGNRGPRNIAVAANAVGRMMAQDNGPRIAVLELGGWDTHAGQAPRLTAALQQLASGVTALKDALGPAWRETAIALVTEFGRTVAPNGTGGTDHGTGTAAFLIGGRVNGGRVLANWPGLSPDRLYQNRDLLPTTDLAQMFKGVLAQHFGLQAATIDRTVFPGNDRPALANLIRA